MLSRLNVVLATVLLLVIALTIAIRSDHSQPNWEFLPEMKYSPALHAYEVQPLFPNGRTQQPAVPGTIAREHLPLHYVATKEDAIRAGDELSNPFTARSDAEAAPAPLATPTAELAASISRGKEMYRVFCVSCHGPSGAGDGPVSQRGFPPPPPLLTGKSTQMKDGQLFHILTYGQGSMSTMVAQLNRSERWDVINYVRSLQSKAAVASPPATGSSQRYTPPASSQVKP